MMEVRMMTPDEEAVMNMELFKTEELFLKRVKAAVLTLLKEDGEVQVCMDTLMHRRINSTKESMAGNIASAIRNSY